MEGAEHTRIVIDLEVGSDPIAGSVAEDGDERRFVGWLALVRELERVARFPRQHSDSDGPHDA